jgi:hypothetical protein
MTAIEYLFAAAMAMIIVWVVAEVGQNALRPITKSKHAVKKTASVSRGRKVGKGNAPSVRATLFSVRASNCHREMPPNVGISGHS